MSNRVRHLSRIAGALLLVAVGQWVIAPADVCAAITPWAINSSQSSVTLSFPDQAMILGGFPVTVHVANQSGAGSTWNDGNTSPLAGTIVTDYTPATIQFLPGMSNMYALTSGSYRPDPASFVSPDYTTTGAAPADFGGKALDATGVIGDLMYFALNDIIYDAESLPLALAGPDFNTTGIGFGMSSGTVLADGVPTPLGSLSDMLIPLTPTSGFAGLSIGTISSGVMTLGFTLHISIDFGNGVVLTGSAPPADGGASPLADPQVMDGAMWVQIVAYQVPEPSTRWLALLGGPGAAALAVGCRRRRRPAHRGRQTHVAS